MVNDHLNLEALSKFLDGESDPEILKTVENHLKECPSCRERLGKMNKLKTETNKKLISQFSFPIYEKGSKCPYPQVMSGYISGTLDKDDMEVMEEHLFHCNACLEDVMEGQYVLRRMKNSELLPVPEEIQQMVNRLLLVNEDVIEKVPKVIFCLMKKGFRFVKTLSENLKDIEVTESFLPEPLYRSSDQKTFQKGYKVLLEQDNISLQCQIRKMEEGKLALKIKAVEEGKPLVSRRISIYSNNQVMASEKSDEKAEVEFLSLFPGDYLIKISGVEVKLAIQILIESSKK